MNQSRQSAYKSIGQSLLDNRQAQINRRAEMQLPENPYRQPPSGPMTGGRWGGKPHPVMRPLDPKWLPQPVVGSEPEVPSVEPAPYPVGTENLPRFDFNNPPADLPMLDLNAPAPAAPEPNPYQPDPRFLEDRRRAIELARARAGRDRMNNGMRLQAL